MESTEARFLFPGATVLDGATPRTITSATTTADPSPMTRITFADACPQRPDAIVHPARTPVTLSTLYTVSWVIHHQQRDPQTGRGTGAVHTTGVRSPGQVRDHWTHSAHDQAVVKLTEWHTTVRYIPTALESLPGPGEHDPSRFYTLYGSGPSVLHSADALREHLRRLQWVHDHSHRAWWSPSAVHDPNIYACGRCAAGPLDLMPVAVEVERTGHEVTRDQLPDAAPALGQAAAFARVTAARQRQPQNA